ncbi:DUF1405 domain-containing protein [Paenibacillus physcomitrellae]|uniref:DUF1405 domain-containing protein n=1 Tax=Paenibacillus physcomitrellae TaxID=1619311 RepID=UPI000B8CCA90|nr:DUF1405 domain-containing protein [Paenibacillus physcomitrellae]
MYISRFWSRGFLTHPAILWLLLVCNLLGTIYGYIWYGAQLEYTAQNNPSWLLIFVPDSPTASLFFTLALVFLLFEHRFGAKWLGIRMLIEALAVVTSVKYGIWAVTMIVAGAYQGDALVWQDYMLMTSHLAMAAEVLLFLRFFRFGTMMAAIAGVWTLLNDTIDYTYGVFPWLPRPLQDDLVTVQNFTFLLTLFCIAVTWVGVRRSGRL